MCMHQGDIVSSVMAMVHTKKSWCIESQNLMPLATDKYCGKVFRFMKSEESVAGEDSKLAGTCFELAGTHFIIKKIKF
jgi:hypothetical protein